MRAADNYEAMGRSDVALAEDAPVEVDVNDLPSARRELREYMATQKAIYAEAKQWEASIQAHEAEAEAAGNFALAAEAREASARVREHRVRVGRHLEENLVIYRLAKAQIREHALTHNPPPVFLVPRRQLRPRERKVRRARTKARSPGRPGSDDDPSPSPDVALAGGAR